MSSILHKIDIIIILTLFKSKILRFRTILERQNTDSCTYYGNDGNDDDDIMMMIKIIIIIIMEIL